EGGGRQDRGVELDEALVGRGRQHLAVVDVGHRRVRLHDGGPDPAGADVDDEVAHPSVGGGAGAGDGDGSAGAGAGGFVVRDASNAPKIPVELAMKAWKTRLKASGPLLPAMRRTATTTTTSTANDVRDARAPWTRGASRRWRPACHPAATCPPRSTK